jgi:hypothetical protein
VCPIGTYADKTGQADLASCKACSGAQWAIATGSAACSEYSECAKGTYFAGDQAAQNGKFALTCTSTPAGSKWVNSSAVAPCTRGTWQSDTGGSDCRSCAAGSVRSDCDKLGAIASTCTVCPAGTIYMAAVSKTNAVEITYKYYGGNTKEGVKCALSTQQDSCTNAVGSKTLSTCGTTFAYDKVTGESLLWGKPVGGVSYAPNLDLAATCVSECFTGVSDTTAKTTMSPYYGTCIALPAEVSAVAPNSGVGEYGITKCGANTFYNTLGKCETCPKDTLSSFGTSYHKCIACPAKTGRNVADEFCTALVANKQCDAATEIAVSDILTADRARLATTAS